MIKQYQQLGVALNEINRNMGLLDLVPEVIVPPVVEKLRFVHELVRQGRAENGALAPVDDAAAAPPVAMESNDLPPGDSTETRQAVPAEAVTA
jgi:hypothetical protein